MYCMSVIVEPTAVSVSVGQVVTGVRVGEAVRVGEELAVTERVAEGEAEGVPDSWPSVGEVTTSDVSLLWDDACAMRPVTIPQEAPITASSAAARMTAPGVRVVAMPAASHLAATHHTGPIPPRRVISKLRLTGWLDRDVNPIQ